MSNLKSLILSTAFAFIALCTLALPAHAVALPIPIAHYTFDNNANLGEDSQASFDLTTSGSPAQAAGKFGFGVNTTSGFLYRTIAGPNNEPAFEPSAGSPAGDYAVSFWYQRNTGGSGVPVGRGDLSNISTNPTSGYAALVVDTSQVTNAINGNLLVQTATEYAPPPAGSSAAVNSIALPGNDTSVFQHVVIQRRLGNLEMFLNGSQVGSSVAFGTTLDTGLSLAVGAGGIDPDSTNFGASLSITDVPSSLNFAGIVDDVQIFDFGLDPSEIVEIFGSAPVDPPFGGIPEPSSLVLLILGMLGLSRVRRRHR